MSGEARRGSLSGREADVVDIYHFRVRARGDASLALRGGVHADLVVLDETGHQLACACGGLKNGSLLKRLGPGTYFAVARARPGAAGAYEISLRLRRPTIVSIALSRSGRAANDLDAASTAFFYERTDEARSKLQDFVSELGEAPLQAQLTSDQHNELTAAATKVRASLGGK